ncbi:hypothetical protein [Rhodanobacter sp. T12-5]|uniref:hypothetical protein n=1 Tax=Rhodanobacter sp. T12-5 TaxID=2024611 RepID=UPI0011ED259F|nr:hypothetical protein [Rhodanobacter sp. T12-5]
MQIRPGDYQVFLTHWTPDGAPLCAVMQTEAQWSRVLHPAAVMWRNKHFAPPANFWKDHAVVLLGRSVFGTNNTRHVFRLESVTRGSGTLTLAVHFEPPHASSYKMGWFIAVAVNKPLPQQIAFVENGALLCTLGPGPARWLSPVAH